MNVLIAKSKEETILWPGTAVVIDVLCGATDVCALLGKGARTVRLCADAQTADELVASSTNLTVFCAEKLALPHKDNSPVAAASLAAGKPALVVEKDTQLAVESLRRATTVLLGCFCNFTVLAKELKARNEDVFLIPASLFGECATDEDSLCAWALKEYLQGDENAARKAVSDFTATLRFSEISSQLPTQDIQFALHTDSLPVVVQVNSELNTKWSHCALYRPSETTQPAASAQPTLEAVSLEPIGDEKAPACANFLDEVTQTFQRVQEPPMEKLSEEESAQDEKDSRLGMFFSGLLKAIKSEKEELEKTLYRAVSEGKQQEKTELPKIEEGIKTVSQQTGKTPAETPAPSVLPLTQPSADVQPPVHTQPPVTTQPPTPTISLTPKVAPGAHAPVTRSVKPRMMPLPPSVNQAAQSNSKKAVVLFSGGLDSTTCLYWARAQGYTCEALTVSYGQRHAREVEAACKITQKLGIKHHLIDLHLPWLAASSSLTNHTQPLPDISVTQIPQAGIPSTYVPGRNLMFLSIAGSLVDAIKAQALIAGPNAVDFSGYPDCTPAFFKAAGDALNRGTRQGVREGIEVLAPLMTMSKAEIVRLAASLGVPFELTWSCYAGGAKPCGHCDSCKLRAKGFAEAGVHDTSLD